MDALNQFLDVEEKIEESMFAIANFPHVKFPVVELLLLRSLFPAFTLHDNTTPRVILANVLVEDVLESFL